MQFGPLGCKPIISQGTSVGQTPGRNFFHRLDLGLFVQHLLGCVVGEQGLGRDVAGFTHGALMLAQWVKALVLQSRWDLSLTLGVHVEVEGEN